MTIGGRIGGGFSGSGDIGMFEGGKGSSGDLGRFLDVVLGDGVCDPPKLAKGPIDPERRFEKLLFR